MVRLFLMSTVILVSVCELPAQQYGSFKDARDGKVYKTVKIGSQVWMAENLNTSKFRNGEEIPFAITDTDWEYTFNHEKLPAYCIFDNNPEFGSKYGKLYNWYAVNDPRGLAPEGWHIPTKSEWIILLEYLGGKEKAFAKMKSKSGWLYNMNGSNSSGFSGSPSGHRRASGAFGGLEEEAGWWMNSHVDYSFQLFYKNGYSPGVYPNRDWGLSVRCIKNDEPDRKIKTQLEPFDYNKGEKSYRQYTRLKDLRDGTSYRTAKYGDQIFMAENLNTSLFLNGDTIPEAKNLEQWKNAEMNKQPIWCYNEYDSAYEKRFGKIYNWYAVNDPRGLAPEGWHVATKDDLEALEKRLGYGEIAVKKMKSVNGWKDEEENTGELGLKIRRELLPTNESGFDLIPAGYCSSGGFVFEGEICAIWTSDSYNDWNAYTYKLFSTPYSSIDPDSKEDGYYVRCFLSKKDNTQVAIKNQWKTETVRSRQNSEFEEINYLSKNEDTSGQIHNKRSNFSITKTWMAENLNIGVFSNGEVIPEARTKQDWENACKNRKPAWCFYDNNPTNANKFGRIYNWYALDDPRGLIPDGWHLATVDEWFDYFEHIRTNEKGFQNLLGGYRDNKEPIYANLFHPLFRDGGKVSKWWAAEINTNGTFSVTFSNTEQQVNDKKGKINMSYKGEDRPFEMGYYIRLVKNANIKE
jgi:uncharacterized protein (TIGR02145 family)